MRIGELAAKVGVSVQTLRYYERRGLISRPRRQASGYRAYDAAEVARVRFIRRAQHLGFTLVEISDLLGYRAASTSSCAAVEKRAQATLDRIAEKMAGLRQMRDALTPYVAACGTRQSLQDCPLLTILGGPEDIK